MENMILLKATIKFFFNFFITVLLVIKERVTPKRVALRYSCRKQTNAHSKVEKKRLLHVVSLKIEKLLQAPTGGEEENKEENKERTTKNLSF